MTHGNSSGKIRLVEGSLSVDLLTESYAERLRCEQDLDAHDIPLAMTHRSEWIRHVSSAEQWFLAVRENSGRCVYGCGIDVSHTRAAPGKLLLRCERFGLGAAPDALEASLTALASLAHRDRRVLHIGLEVLSLDPSFHETVGDTATKLGFHPPSKMRLYRDTVAIDLLPSETEIFASLHQTARRHVRAALKKPIDVQSITDTEYQGRMADLAKETFARTSGSVPLLDWASIITFSQLHPHLSRLAGLFRSDTTGPDRLVAFAWGRHHGDHVDYTMAASTRDPNLRFPLGYGPVWDLIQWAKRHNAHWFDLGGVMSDSKRYNHFGGINSFKHKFCNRTVHVGEEWVLEPRRAEAFMANTISSLAAGTRRARSFLVRTLRLRKKSD